MKQWQLRGLLIITGLLCSLGIAEIVLRAARISYPRFYQGNHLLGHRLNPGAEGWFRSEGEAYITINAEGWRDTDHTKDKPEQVLRIAVLGDSYAEALQVPLQQTFWALLEQNLNSRNCFQQSRVEVLNFGVSGYGTAHQLLALQQYVWQYDPDIVLLAFFTGNDIRNNSQALETQRKMPFFVFRDGQLALDTSGIPRVQISWISHIRQALYRYSRVYQLLSRARKLLFAHHANTEAAPEFKGQELGLDARVYHRPASSDWQDAWEVTEELLLRVNNDVRRHHARFVVTVLSSGIQVYPDTATRQRFLEQLDIKDLFYPDKRLQSFLERAGIEVILLAPEFQRYADAHQVFLHGFDNTESGFGHWNRHGHQLAGELIASYLCATGHPRGDLQ